MVKASPMGRYFNEKKCNRRALQVRKLLNWNTRKIKKNEKKEDLGTK